METALSLHSVSGFVAINNEPLLLGVWNLERKPIIKQLQANELITTKHGDCAKFPGYMRQI
jgi:hypothetical protein